MQSPCGAAERLTAPAPPAAGAPAVRLAGWCTTLGAHTQGSATVAEKFLRDLKGAFFKKPPFRAPAAGNRVSMFAAGMFVWHFLFASFSFSLKRKRRTMESDRTIDRVTLMSGRGAYGMPLTGFGANIRCVHPTDSESCTAGADHWSPLQKDTLSVTQSVSIPAFSLQV